MTVETLTRAQEAFVALANHCVGCPDCKVNLDRPQETRGCPTAQTLYRAWRPLWREENGR
jgi:putative hemolysin